MVGLSGSTQVDETTTDERLREQTASIDEELTTVSLGRPATTSKRTVEALLFANLAVAAVEGTNALLRFGLKVPGEKEPRPVVEILLDREALKALLATLGAITLPGHS